MIGRPEDLLSLLGVRPIVTIGLENFAVYRLSYCSELEFCLGQVSLWRLSSEQSVVRVAGVSQERERGEHP